MNATTSNTFSVDSFYQDARTQFENVKNSFDNTWSSTQSALEFLASIIHRQTQRIQSLETRTHGLEKQLDEKTKRVESLENQMSTTNRSHEEQLAQKQQQLDESETRNAAMVDAANRGNALLADFRQRADVNAKLHAQSLAQVAILKQKLAQTTQDPDRGQRESDDQEKVAAIEVALKKELEARSDAVRQAATAVAKEAADLNAALRARVITLEEQLQTSRSVVEKLTKAQEHSTTKPPSTSARPGTPHRIITGTYRPKPLLQPNSTAPQLSPDNPISSNDPSDAHRMPSLSRNTSASSTEMSSREVIDLTSSPGGLKNRNLDAPPAKRQRVASDVPMRSVSPPSGISSASRRQNPTHEPSSRQS